MTPITLEAKVHDFLAQKRIAVVGVSRNDGDHAAGKLVSSERPSLPGPRHSGQSDADGAAMTLAETSAHSAPRRRTLCNNAGYMCGLRNPFKRRLRESAPPEMLPARPSQRTFPAQKPRNKWGRLAAEAQVDL